MKSSKLFFSTLQYILVISVTGNYDFRGKNVQEPKATLRYIVLINLTNLP